MGLHPKVCWMAAFFLAGGAAGLVNSNMLGLAAGIALLSILFGMMAAAERIREK